MPGLSLKTKVADYIFPVKQNQANLFETIPAALSGNVESAKLLIAYGADVNFVDNEGNTPLHRAIFHTEIIKIVRPIKS